MSEKRFDFKDEYITLDGGVFATAKDSQNAELISRTLNQLYDESEENKLHKERISLLSSLLDLADAIIDTSDNEKAKQVWDNKNEQTEKEWERILNE